MRKIHTIVTHLDPHLDEVVAIALVLMFGKKYFGLADNIKFVFWNAGALPPDGRTAEEWGCDGYLLIGVGGGRFDEHKTIRGDRKLGECTATLIAKELDIAENRELKKLLTYVLGNDTSGKGRQFDFADDILTYALVNPGDSAGLLQFGIEAFKLKYRGQVLFWEAVDELKSKLSRETLKTVQGPKGPTTLASVVSDNPILGRASRHLKIGVLVVKRSSGAISIFANQATGISLDDTAQIVRRVEQEFSKKVVTSDWDKLREEGHTEGVPEWFYFPKLLMLCNWTPRNPTMPVTRLTLEQIVKLVTVGIDPKRFQEDREGNCRKDICDDGCPWRNLGLARCRTVRWNGQHKSK